MDEEHNQDAVKQEFSEPEAQNEEETPASESKEEEETPESEPKEDSPKSEEPQEQTDSDSPEKEESRVQNTEPSSSGPLFHELSIVFLTTIFSKDQKKNEYVNYKYELSYGCLKWTVQRRHKDFVKLHTLLQQYYLDVPELKLPKSWFGNAYSESMLREKSSIFFSFVKAILVRDEYYAFWPFLTFFEIQYFVPFLMLQPPQLQKTLLKSSKSLSSVVLTGLNNSFIGVTSEAFGISRLDAYISNVLEKFDNKDKDYFQFLVTQPTEKPVSIIDYYTLQTHAEPSAGPSTQPRQPDYRPLWSLGLKKYVTSTLFIPGKHRSSTSKASKNSYLTTPLLFLGFSTGHCLIFEFSKNMDRPIRQHMLGHSHKQSVTIIQIDTGRTDKETPQTEEIPKTQEIPPPTPEASEIPQTDTDKQPDQKPEEKHDKQPEEKPEDEATKASKEKDASNSKPKAKTTSSTSYNLLTVSEDNLLVFTNLRYPDIYKKLVFPGKAISCMQFDRNTRIGYFANSGQSIYIVDFKAVGVGKNAKDLKDAKSQAYNIRASWTGVDSELEIIEKVATGLSGPLIGLSILSEDILMVAGSTCGKIHFYDISRAGEFKVKPGQKCTKSFDDRKPSNNPLPLLCSIQSFPNLKSLQYWEERKELFLCFEKGLVRIISNVDLNRIKNNQGLKKRENCSHEKNDQNGSLKTGPLFYEDDVSITIPFYLHSEFVKSIQIDPTCPTTCLLSLSADHRYRAFLCPSLSYRQSIDYDKLYSQYEDRADNREKLVKGGLIQDRASEEDKVWGEDSNHLDVTINGWEEVEEEE